MARLELQYKKELRKKIQNDLNLSNPMEVPKITKITLNMGVGEAVADKKILDNALKDMEQIAAQGVKISRWVTMHGFSINVNTNLDFYDSIIPCGIFDRGVTSISEILGKLIDMNQIKMIITEKFNNNFKKDIL